MSIPYLWTVHSNYPNRLIGEYDESGPDRFLLRRTEPVGPDFGVPEISFEVPLDRLAKLDNLYNSSGIPLVNTRLRLFLTDRVGKDVEFVPARVIADDGESSEYALLNVLAQVRAIDYDQTVPEFMTDGKSLLGFRRLAHLPDSMSEHGLAREADYRGHMLVAEWLADELMAKKFKGFALLRATEMEW